MDYCARTKDCFLKACTSQRKADLQEAVLSRWWQEIADHYGEKQRCYHTLAHIWDMLELLERMCPQVVQESPAVILAIIFHDVIYEPKKPDNEEQSAILFEQFADECLKEDKALRQSVADYILLTKTHSTEEHRQADIFGSSEAHYVLDLDMAVLARGKKAYDQYATAIRSEYSHVPTETFRQRRASALRSFLKQTNIFATRQFREKFEAQARENVQKEIQELESPSL